MHRTNHVPRSVGWGLVIGLLLYGGTEAQAQDGRTRGIIVPINVTKTVETPGKRLVRRITIANPAIARVNPSVDAKAVMITGLIAGNTQVQVILDDNAVDTLDLVVQSDVEYLRYMIKMAVPTANVEPIPSANNVFILSGTVLKSEDIPIILATAQSVVGAGIVNALRVGGVMQVQLDVVIATVARSELRQMSFSFFSQGQRHFFGSNLAGPAGSIASSSALVSPEAAAGALASGPANLALGFVSDRQSFFGFLQALRTEGLAKFMAEPRVVTLSGKPANFLSGGRLAVPEPSGLGTNAVRFEDFGTQLNFLPVVLGNGKIYLEVEPIVNTVNAANGTTIAGTTIPGFDTQRMHTTVEMEDGQTFAIGGLVQHSVNAGTTKVPVVGDIPFLNTLFSTKSYREEENELLIIITPHLVDPLACNQLPKYLPGEETRSPDDFELFLEGILEAPRGQRCVCPRGHYQAAYLNDPTADVFPCGTRGCGHGCFNGSCCGHGCANGACCGNGCANGACFSSGCANGSCSGSGHLGEVPGAAIGSIPYATSPQGGLAPQGLPQQMPAPSDGAAPKVLPSHRIEEVQAQPQADEATVPVTTVNGRMGIPLGAQADNVEAMPAMQPASHSPMTAGGAR